MWFFKDGLNFLFFIIVKSRINISIGSNSRVRWIRLFGCKPGKLRIGSNSIVNCRIDYDGHCGEIKVGNRCFIGSSHLVCRDKIIIGDDVIISWGVTIVDHNSHSLEWLHRQHDVTDWINDRKDWGKVIVKSVQVKDKVWIGFGATILKGVILGEGAVIGACSVVTRDVPPYTVVAGNPARIIKPTST
jgi:acetyltransferase-like isoleucine patch superfamily enzyme